MTEHRLVQTAAACAVLVGMLVSGLVMLICRPETVTEETCARLAAGMTVAEVEALFGRGADCQFPVDGPPDLPYADLRKLKVPLTGKVWDGEDYLVDLTFDADGRIVWINEYPVEPLPWHWRLTFYFGF